MGKHRCHKNTHRRECRDRRLNCHCHENKRKRNCKPCRSITERNFRTNCKISKTLVIKKSGRYCLCENINFDPQDKNDHAIIIDADNVVLDLCGFTLRQVNDITSIIGIKVLTGHKNVTILGSYGAIRNFSQLGIRIQGGTQDITLGDDVTQLNINGCGKGTPLALSDNGVAQYQGAIDIPIILVTAKAGAEDTKEGLEAGAFDYIKKPFNKVELMARINSALKLADAHKKYLEAEQKNTFAATVVTANHRIKQPLTLMSLSSAALKREINRDQISKEALLKRLNYIDTAIKEISDVLNQLNAIKKPILTDYVKDIKMVECENEDIKAEPNKETREESVKEIKEESDKLLDS